MSSATRNFGEGMYMGWVVREDGLWKSEVSRAGGEARGGAGEMAGWT